MKHYHYLGCSGVYCCVIESLVQITEENSAEVLPFCKISSTNWGGCDKIERTREKENLEFVGDYIPLRESYAYTYEDYDYCHRLVGTFRFNKLQEVTRHSNDTVQSSEVTHQSESYHYLCSCGGMADAVDLGSTVERRAGSNPVMSTIDTISGSQLYREVATLLAVCEIHQTQ